MSLFYTALDETRKTQITYDNFKLIGITHIKVGPRDEFYIDKLYYTTNMTYPHFSQNMYHITILVA